MKTAISIPDQIFARADRLARRLGKSRSELYAEAVSRYLAAHDQDTITARLNEVYRDIDPIEAQLDPALARAQQKAIGKERW